MAAAWAAACVQRFCQEEYLCFICMEHFKDPVILIECGHNFCRACLTRYWEGPEGGEVSCCPQCRGKVQRNLIPNRQLAYFMDLTRKLWLQKEKISQGKGGVCGKHREPLTLFCKEDEAPICMVCQFSEQHRDHQKVPLEQALQDCKELIYMHPQLVGAERAKVLVCKSETEEENQELLDVSKTLQSIRYEQRERFQNPLVVSPKLERWFWDVCDGNIIRAKRMKQFRAKVTLDPKTAHPHLILSEDRKSVRYGDKSQHLPNNPARFDLHPYVLGCEGFLAGKHYWEVTVECEGSWAVGLARKCVRRKGIVGLSTDEGFWAVGQWLGKYRATDSSKPSFLPLSGKLRRIWVSLNCIKEQVAFHDADTGTLLHIFSGACFPEEALLPFFSVCGNASLTISD